MKMVKELLDFFNVKTTLAYARAAQPRPYVGPSLFPTQNIQDLDFEYFKSANRLPVMATVQAYGAETPIASREGIEKVKGEIPPIKRKINLDERYIIALRREGLGDIDIVKREVFNDLDRLISSVYDRIEAFRMEAISTGKLTIAENGVVMTVDYGVDSDHKDTLESTALWSAASTAVPITDIQGWVQQIVDDTGIRPTRALTSRSGAGGTAGRPSVTSPRKSAPTSAARPNVRSGPEVATNETKTAVARRPLAPRLQRPPVRQTIGSVTWTVANVMNARRDPCRARRGATTSS